MARSIVGYAERPCRAELVAVLAAGAVHVGIELWLSAGAAAAYNTLVSLGFTGYLFWRAWRSGGALRAWGMRWDNFPAAMAAHGTLGLAGAAVLVAIGLLLGELFLPATFWMTLALYPAWGIAQQFALQNLVARNLTDLVPGTFPLALAAAGLFALAHYPRLELVALTFVAGLLLTLVYRRHPNLWAVGLVHGLLGSLTFYVVLKQDPGKAILGLLGGP